MSKVCRVPPVSSAGIISAGKPQQFVARDKVNLEKSTTIEKVRHGRSNDDGRSQASHKRRRVTKKQVVPEGFRSFKILVNGFKQVCRLQILETTTLAEFRKQVLLRQLEHPQAIPEGAWGRVVLFKARPTTMKTTCGVPEHLVIPSSETLTVASLQETSCVHLYLLCPGPPLPKEFPGPHLRLAKRDTKVCEAHSKQERRALRRAVTPLEDNSTTALTGVATVDGCSGPTDIGALLAAPVIAAAGEQSLPTSTVTPPTIPVQLVPGEAPVLCSVDADAFETPSTPDIIYSKMKQGLCSSEGCNKPAYNGHIGNTMVLPASVVAKEPWLFCRSCVDQFHKTSLCETVMGALVSCPEQQIHEAHLNYQTTPKTGPLRYGRLAACRGHQRKYFCKCVERVCESAYSKYGASEIEEFLKFLSLGLRPRWRPARQPKVMCTGSQSFHIQFTKRPNRISVHAELVNFDANNCATPFLGFGERFDDSIYLIPGNPLNVTKYMVEGLNPETRYAVRIVEVVGGSQSLGKAMTHLCTIIGDYTIVRTQAAIPTQKPFARLTHVAEAPEESSAQSTTPPASVPRSTLDHLAEAAMITMASSEGRHAWAVPVRVDNESQVSMDPVLARTDPEGDEFAVFPQATPEFAYQQAVASSENTSDTVNLSAAPLSDQTENKASVTVVSVTQQKDSVDDAVS